MKSDALAKAIACWAEYETLCGRGVLLSEASLKYPIGEFLAATQEHDLKPEEPYPKEYQQKRGRPKSMDFCLRRVGGDHAWWAILESKWISDRREFNEEIFDDLLRLEVVRRNEQAETFDRLFLIAGERKYVHKAVFEKEINIGGGYERKKLFALILPAEVGKALNVNIAEAHEKIRNYWILAAKNCSLAELPLSFKAELLAKCDIDGMTCGCWIWCIKSVGGRRTRQLEDLEKPGAKGSVGSAPQEVMT